MSRKRTEAAWLSSRLTPSVRSMQDVCTYLVLSPAVKYTVNIHHRGRHLGWRYGQGISDARKLCARLKLSVVKLPSLTVSFKRVETCSKCNTLKFCLQQRTNSYLFVFFTCCIPDTAIVCPFFRIWLQLHWTK